MATRSRHPRRKWRRPRAVQAPPAQQDQTQTQGSAPQEQVEPPLVEQAKPAKVIRKGIYLSALIYLEGDLPAPDDFIAPATNTLQSVLDQALKGEHNGLSMTLKKIEVRNDIEQDDKEDGSDGEEEKFQF